MTAASSSTRAATVVPDAGPFTGETTPTTDAVARPTVRTGRDDRPVRPGSFGRRG